MSQDLRSPRHDLVVTTPGDHEVVMERVFDAPPELVWRLWTDASRIPLFWGPRAYTTRVDEHDFRVGGTWRYVNVADDGTEHAFRGEFRAIDAPHSFTWTFEYEGTPGDVAVETMRLEERDGATVMTWHSRFERGEARDQMLGAGMVDGSTQMMDRFEELLEAQPHG